MKYLLTAEAVEVINDMFTRIKESSLLATNHDDVDAITHGRIAGQSDAGIVAMHTAVVVPDINGSSEDDFLDEWEVDEEVIDG